jgi:hypothetical protein
MTSEKGKKVVTLFCNQQPKHVLCLGSSYLILNLLISSINLNFYYAWRFLSVGHHSYCPTKLIMFKLRVHRQSREIGPLGEEIHLWP